MTIALLLAGAYVGVLLAAVAWRLIAWAVRVAIDQFSRKPVQTTVLASAPHVVVTLVHGTFARRADWTLPSSRLCRSICAATHGPVRSEHIVARKACHNIQIDEPELVLDAITSLVMRARAKRLTRSQPKSNARAP